MDQRTCIKFCVKNEIKCADAFRMLTVAYGEATLDRSNVYRWYKMFSEGREDVNDEERAGRPSTSTTDEKINEVEKMILANHRITVREVAEDLNISIGSCHSIFINDLGMRRVDTKFVPKLLNCDQKQHRMNNPNEMLDSVRNDPNLLQRVITGDEAWVYGYDVETKAQSSQWKLPHEPRPKKTRQVRSNVKVLLTVFFDCRGVVHHEFLPQGRTVGCIKRGSHFPSNLANTRVVGKEVKLRSGDDEEEKVACLLLLTTGILADTQELLDPPACEDLRNRCHFRSGCSRALKDYMEACGDILAGHGNGKCPSACVHALFALRSTSIGYAMEGCACHGSPFCLAAHRRMEVCREAVDRVSQDPEPPCGAARAMCRADSACDTALKYVVTLCRGLFTGHRCSPRCNNSLAILSRQPRGHPLINSCSCDGSERYPCRELHRNAPKLCYGRTEVVTTTPKTPSSPRQSITTIDKPKLRVNSTFHKQAKTAEVKAVSELDEEIGFLLEVSAVEDSSNLDNDEDECRRRWTAEIQVNGKKVKFKLDSQADVTCVPLCLFKKIMGQQRLVESDINIRAAEFSELQTVGMFISTLRNGNYEIKEKIYVIRRLSEPLLSRRACELLNLARRIEVVATRINPIKEFPEVFEGLGQIGNPYEIKLKPGAKPYAVHTPRRVPIPLMEKLKTRLEELEKAGIIAQVNVATEWCAPTVIAGKPNGDIRHCVDLSRLNEHVQREVHPMPVVEHMLGQLGEARFFSKLDANSGFHQIPLSPDCQHLTTFITPFGRYKYCRMPFGIPPLPPCFNVHLYRELNNN
ncbi:hypothetical protein LAZ67_10004011 [Cordylochernes scorpioides]|uniref:GDNF/GAS1 domain-containing protein n=1 Tax=Cordylochernes scorpioides TaxID=51811 RepID=A0ABY6L059_9ARAC|nr:hypothetical protein LAZ67_10004011 [Cordylochernes scorpioides]